MILENDSLSLNDLENNSKNSFENGLAISINAFKKPENCPGVINAKKNYGFGTIAIHAVNNPESWDMNQVYLIKTIKNW